MAKDRKIDMVILGLLAYENMTGYDIKKMIDEAISFFWKGSFGSIYPALSALQDEGMVKKITSKSGEKKASETKREKIYYAITKKGETALKTWLSDSKASNDLKYETLLKLFFGGVVDSLVSLNTIKEFEKEIAAELSVLKVYKDNLSKVLDEKDHLYYYLTVTFGVETYEGYLRWCKEAKKMLSK